MDRAILLHPIIVQVS